MIRSNLGGYCAWTAGAAALAGLFMQSPVHSFTTAVAIAAEQAAPRDDAALKTFRAALATYMTLRGRVSKEVPPLRVTPRPEEIQQASDALATAIVRGRQAARQGQFFDAATAAEFRRRLASPEGATELSALLATIDDDQETGTGIRVHGRYPRGQVLPTSPPTILHALPPLPPQLEYRFIGRTLILRDVDAAMIIDYLPNALPAR
jgi:hypothetical protein